MTNPFTSLAEYRCEVCGWTGAEEPADGFGDACCPRCGVMAKRLSAWESWGASTVIFGVVVLAVVAFIWWS